MNESPRSGAVLFVKDLNRVAAFYEKVLGLQKIRTATDHIVLRFGGYELVVHAIPAEIAGPDFVDSPLSVREDCSVKLVFYIDSISTAREAAARLGGLLHGTEREWKFDGATVCDGCDPEGNVIQLRQPQGANKPIHATCEDARA
jgi:predicted enzyme related to lactoylglutathione lyase